MQIASSSLPLYLSISVSVFFSLRLLISLLSTPIVMKWKDLD